MNIKLPNIQQEDIDKAVPGDPQQCALAVAIKRENPEVEEVIVSLSKRCIWVDGERIPLGKQLVDDLLAFDEGKKLEPMILSRGYGFHGVPMTFKECVR